MRACRLAAFAILFLVPSFLLTAQEPLLPKTSAAATSSIDAAPNGEAGWRLLPVPVKDLPAFLEKHPEYQAIPRGAWNAWFQRATQRDARPAELAHAGLRLTSAEWQAEFNGSLMRGELALQIEAGDKPQLLALDPWPFSLASAAWRDSKDPVVIGNDAQGQTKVLIARSGTLTIPVELSGKTQSDEQVFQWTGPHSLARRLVLTSGEEWVANSDDGVLVERKTVAGKKEVSVWQATGPHPLTIRFTPRSANANPLIVMRPKVTYELGTRGLDLLWEGRWEQFDRAPEKVLLQIDPALQVQDVTWGEQTLPYKLGTALPSGALPLEIAIPQRASTSSPTLRINACAPVITDQLASLPQIRAPNMIMQDGSWNILALSPYRIDQLETRDCRVTQTEKLTMPLQGEALNLQTTGRSPDVQLLTRWQKPRGTWRSVLTINNQDREPHGIWCGELVLDEGHVNLIQFSVDSSWIVESVECEPAALVRSWQRIERVTGRTLYRLHLKRDLQPREALRLTFRARTPNRASVVRIEPDQFDLVVPLEFERERSYISVALGDEYETEFLGTGEPRRIDPRDLPPGDLALLTNAARGRLYRWPGVAAGWGLRLMPRPPRVKARLETKLELTNDGVLESYRIHCQNAIQQNGKLTLNFSHAQNEIVQWSLESTREPLPAKRITAIDPPRGNAAAREQWEVDLPEKPGEDFVLVGQRKRGFANDYQPALLTLANIQDQSGTLRFFSSADHAPSVEMGNLPLVPLPEEIDTVSGELARWSYSVPANEDEQVSVPALKRSTAANPAAKVVIWSATLETLLQPESAANQQLTLLLENAGHDRWSFELPAGASGLAVFVNEQLVIPRTSPDKPQQIQLELDPRQRYLQIRLNWRSEREQHAWRISATPQWPRFPEPPLTRRWVIWTTSGYQPLQQSATHTPVEQAANTWIGPGIATAEQERWLTNQLLATAADDSLEPATTAALAAWWERWHGQPRATATWRELSAEFWTAAFAANTNERAELAVDVRALAMLGITADAAVQSNQVETFLREAVLLTGPRGWLLTTRQGLMNWTGLRPLPKISRSYAVPANARYAGAGSNGANVDSIWVELAVPLNRWGMSPSLGLLPWPWTGGSPVDLGVEWVPHLIDLELLDEPIPFVETQRTSTLALAIFAGCLGISVWWAVRSAPMKILTGVMLLAGIALLPSGVQILGTAALAGLAAGQALRWLGWWPWAGWLHRRSARPNSDAAPRRGIVYATSLLLLAMLVATAASPWSWGADPKIIAADDNVAANDTAKSIWTIYTPITDDGAAAGDVVYVPRDMAAMILAEQVATDTTDAWLIRSAKYVGQIIRPADESPRSGNWVATLQIQTLAAAQWVRLPYSARELVILPDGIRVAGEAAEWRWTEQRDALEIFIPTAGSHLLEIKFLPLTADRMSAELAFTLPSSPWNEFEINTPANLPLEYDLPGRWQWQPEQRQLLGVSGELPRLEIGWPKYEELQSSTAQVELEVAQWLRVQPALTTLEVRIPIRVLNGRLTELELAVDERLRLLRHRGEAGVVWKAVQKGRSLKLNFVRPLQERGIVELTFVVDSFTGLGTLSLPRCEILGHTVKAQWLFGTVDPSLEFTEQGVGPGMRPVDQTMVQRVWGGDPSRPAFAYQLLRPNLPWKLVTQPREPLVQSTSCETWLSAAQEQIEWGCQTQLEISNGSLLILRGKLAEDWLPDRVIVRQQQQELTQRWSIGIDRQLSIFLEAPLYGEASVMLIGKRTLPTQSNATQTNTTWNWPQWHGQYPRTAQLLFERDTSTLFRLNTRPNWSSVPREDWSKQLAAWPKEYRLVNKLAAVERLPQALWSGKPSPQPIPLRLVSNQPTGSLELSVELIQREKNSWRALVHMHGSLKSGQLDRLEIALPQTCRDIKIDKSVATATIEQDAAQERTLVIRPMAPLSGEWDLAWEHRLEFEPGQPVSWPHLRPHTKLALRELAILPYAEEARSPVWRINGLKQIEFDPARVARAQGRDSQLFEVGEGPSWAEYLPHRAGDTTPEVILASHSLGRQDATQVVGVSTWDLLPEGASRVILALPPDCELLQGRVDGLNLAWRKLTDEELQARLAERNAELIIANSTPAPTTMYEVTLVNQLMPQRLSAVYRCTTPSNSDIRAVTPPTVWNLAVRKSRLQFWQPATEITSQNANDQRSWKEALTLDYLQIGGLLQAALQANNEGNASWRQLWERRFQLQTQHLLLDQADAAELDPETESQQQTQLIELRKLHGITSEAASPRLSAGDVWRAFGLPQTKASFRVVHGNVTATVTDEPNLPTHDWRRLAMLLAAGLLSATMLALVAARTGWGSWPGRHPTASLLVVSLLWLLYMQPREFAVLLAILAVLTWAVKRRAERNLDPTDFELVPAK